MSTLLPRSLFVLALGIGLGTTLPALFHIESAQAQPQEIPTFNPSQSLAPLVEALSDTVVNITVSTDLTTMTPQSPFGWNFGLEQPMPSGQGSGFIISDDGYILTNYHVVDNADTLTVRLSDETEYPATLIGFDDSIDVALLKVTADKELPYVKLGNSDAVRVGDYAVAIGNPFGLSHTVTMGIISAKERVIGSGPYDDYLQTDASINPGNSGGPLFSISGEVIGINTAINPRAQGIGFSVPINKVTTILEDLKEKGHPSRGWLGLNLEPSDDPNTGVRVREVYTNTPAETAGIETGDLITHFDNIAIDSVDTLIRMVGEHKASETLPIQIQRGKDHKELLVTLGERPSQQELATGTFESSSNHQWGVQTALTQGFAKDPGQQGLVVIQIEKNSPLRNDLELGDIILSANNNPIDSQGLGAYSPKKILRLRIWRQGRVLTIEVSP